MKSRHLLMCLIFALTLSVWWQFYQLTFSRSRPKFVNVMEESGSFLHQIKSIPKLTNFTRDNYSSGIEQDREYYVNESIIGISSKVQNIHEIAALLQKPWKLNTTKVSLLREDIARSIRSEMILTKKYIRPFQKITYSLRKQTATISKKFHNTLPEVSPIQRLHKRCSIVGNGGILSKSKCGNAIDRADFVIRCNAPPINEFREDAGVKSNITTFNPSIIISRLPLKMDQHQQAYYPAGNQPNQYPGNVQHPISVQPQVVTASNVHLVENKYVRLEGDSAWSSGLFDCCQDPLSCLAMCCCPICYQCYLSDKLGESFCAPCCVPGFMGTLRSVTRTKYNIPGSILSDCCTACWCSCCSATQISRHHDFITRQPIQ
ncbi:uncharacterized protein LOC117108585 isoform X2 [Anneissia japonica]|uniref:uncharacterized protein LOC117108585 isoform X2 n=1 Tax=Anneissia japonica TaxID=1529436 RepID=UPI0014256BB6|nr:uncharacterized protein LOC117108585 isoform X2 [Anneissia japonica]